MVWIQPPRNTQLDICFWMPTTLPVGIHFTRGCTKVASALIWGQLPCGGWNYVFDFAGENPLKQWYATIGKNALRIGRVSALLWECNLLMIRVLCSMAKFLLRMYVEKDDPVYRYPWKKSSILFCRVNIREGGRKDSHWCTITHLEGRKIIRHL